MNSVGDFHLGTVPQSRDVYWRLLIAWAGIVVAAMLYCALKGVVFENFVFEPGATLRWTITHWGAWPILLPVCYWQIRFAQGRALFSQGLAAAAVVAILGASLFAYFFDIALGGTWSLYSATYHMAPIAAGTFVLFVAIGFWPLYPSGLSMSTTESVVQNGDPVSLPVWKGQVHTAIDSRHIEWARAARNYVEFFANGNLYIMRTSMSEVEQMLPADQLLRAHRSYLVNTRLVAGLQGGKSRPSIVLRSGSRLPVGKTYKAKVFEAFRARSIAA